MRDDAHGFSPEDLKNIDEVTTALRDLVSMYLRSIGTVTELVSVCSVTAVEYGVV